MNDLEQILDHWGPTIAVFLPLIGAAVMLLIPKEEEQTHKAVALATSLGVFAVLIGIALYFNYDDAGRLQYDISKEWISVINSNYHVGVDGISLPLLLLTGLIVPLCVIYTWNHLEEPGNPKMFLMLLLVLETGMVGTFVAQDLILFFVFFEIVLLPMYFMIGVWGGENRLYAAIKFFLFTLFGSALMIVSFLALYFLSDPHTFDITQLPDAAQGIAHTTQLWIFAGMFIGFAIKVPMFPFHTWLPDAHTQAPTVGSVILAAILLKLGTYGFIRVAIPILPEAARSWAWLIGLLAVIGIIYGAVCCLAQTDMKRLIAFSSVSHMGFTMLGIATLTDFGLNAAMMGMVAHGLITGMLFFIAGSVKHRYHTLEIRRLGGLLIHAPKLGWVLGFCALASLGLPGLAGFWGEFPAILASYDPAPGLSDELFRVFMVTAAVGTVFAAGYLLYLYQRVAFGTPKDEWEGHEIHDIETPEWIAWAPLLVLILAIGIYPNFVFDMTDGGVTEALAGVFGGNWGFLTPMLAFETPNLDYHAFGPEIVLVVTVVVLLIADVASERNRTLMSSLAGIGLLAAMVPVLTLAVDGADRVMFGGGYVVDNFTLVTKALFLVAGYVVVLLSTNYVAEGDYYEGEYYFLLLSSIIGMTVMASARDLISIFIALETLSIPAYMLAAWRKRDPRSNEAGLKYYLMGVFASAVMLYGMSLLYGVTGHTLLSEIGAAMGDADVRIYALAVIFVLVGFAFKVSAVPFHTWAPDTYEGAPTPITAFLSVASKAAGFVAILQLVYVGFLGQSDVYQPVFWILAALTMTVGNLVALRQTNIVRLFAYSSVAQAGYMLAPLAVAGESAEAAEAALAATVAYLLIYGAMNLGAFAIIMAVARKTRSGEVDSYGGLFTYAPGLTGLMTVFLFALAGIPPLGGWFAKFVVFRALVEPGTNWGYVLAVLVGVNSVIALFYYARIAQKMWMEEVPDGDTTPVRVPPSLGAALAICAIVTIALGVVPGVFGRLAELATFAM